MIDGVAEMPGDVSRLKREKQPMSDFVRDALMESGLMDAYEARPPYQRNDYLLWINEAKRQSTKEKRLRL
ncbi:YdeI/OmpD-associated family protein [Thiomicrospira cyclica]|uniref:YdeI/OmpD-associated family protein n=1 Tax=Thiomicrospira cyclica TaxID=147268 RepID=UPI00389909C5